jgi:hypothetical protein
MKATAVSSLFAIGIADLTGAAEWLKVVALLVPIVVGAIQALRRPPRREPKPRRKPRIGPTLLLAVALCVACQLLSGCLMERPSAIVRAMGSDTNSVWIHATSVYGQFDLRRNLPAQ